MHDTVNKCPIRILNVLRDDVRRFQVIVPKQR